MSVTYQDIAAFITHIYHSFPQCKGIYKVSGTLQGKKNITDITKSNIKKYQKSAISQMISTCFCN